MFLRTLQIPLWLLFGCEHQRFLGRIEPQSSFEVQLRDKGRGFLGGWNKAGQTEKALTARLRKGLKNLVAGAGFEPTTFGL